MSNKQLEREMLLNQVREQRRITNEKLSMSEATLTNAELLNSTATATETNAVRLLSAEELKATGVNLSRIESINGVRVSKKGNLIATKQLTEAELEEVRVSLIAAGADKAQISALLGLNAVETTNIGITNVLTASFTKLWAVITAHPIGAILTAIGAVAVGTIAYINKVNKDAEKALVEAHENAKQALEDTNASLSDNKSKLQSVNSELEQTKDKIKKISSIGAPTLAEQNELNKLSIANSQLEAQKTLLENNIRLKQRSAALDAKELLGTQTELKDYILSDKGEVVENTEKYDYKKAAELNAFNLKEAYKIYLKAISDGNAQAQEEAKSLVDSVSGESASLTSEILNIIESFKYDDGTIIEGYEDLYKEYMGIIYNIQSLTNPDTFLEISKSVTTGTNIDYEKVIEDAYKSAYEGNFDIDNLNQDFLKALEDSGISKETVEYIFNLKQQEYQSIIDKINTKYNSSNSTVLLPSDATDEERNQALKNNESRKSEVDKINKELTDYAKKNPIEFQLVTSYDEGFKLLDQYVKEEKSKIQSVQNELQSLSEQGNVDLTIRPVIDSSAMKAAGWDVEDGSIATTFTQGEFIWQGGEDDGQYVYIHCTPILPDGTVLTPDQLSNYLYGTLESSKNILEADDKGIVLKVDTDLQGVSAEDIKQLQENGIQTDGMQSFLNSMGQWDDSVHTVQESYYDMSGTVDYVDNAIKRLVEDAKKVEGIDTNETDIQSTISSSISQIATQLEPQFAKLGEAYKAIFTDNGFTLDDVDNSMLEGLRKSFAEIEEEVGVAFDATKLNSFFDALTNGNSTAEQVQQAFNDLATAYFYSTETLAQLNEETGDAIVKQLEELGVVNAKDIVYGKLAAQEEFLAKTGVALADASNDKVMSFLKEAGASETTRQCIYALRFAEIAFNENDVNVKGKVDKLTELARAYGDTATAALGAAAASRVQKGEGDYNDILKEMADNFNATLGNLEIDFKGINDSNKSGGSEKDTTETFDWIERAIESLESKMSRLQKVIDSTYSSFAEKNQAIADQIELVNKEIQLQQQAYNGYMQKAESVGLSDQYKELVKNGSINIEDITDEDLQKAINDYKSWYDKAQETQDKINDSYEESNDLHVKAYENGASELEQLRDSQAISEREYLDRMTTLWKFYYDNQVALAEVAKEEKLAILNDEKSYLQSVGNAALKLLDNQID